MKITNTSKRTKTPSLDDIRAFLLKQNKEELMRLVMDSVAKDDLLFNELVLRIAHSAAGGPDISTYRAAIKRAAKTGGYVEYGEASDYADGLYNVVASLRPLLEDGHVQDVIDLVEYAIGRVEDQIEYVDDSNGEVGGVLEELEELYFEACATGAIDVKTIAERIYRLEMQSSFIFGRAISRYADILGETGIADYAKRVKADWDNLPVLAPGDKDPEKYGRRARLKGMIEWLVRRSGDFDALIAVKSKDLSDTYSFASLVEVYREAGRDGEALACAERGMLSFADALDTKIADLLVSLYHDMDRHDDAMGILWRRYKKWPCLNQCQHLKEYAESIGAWPHWKERALAHLRAKIDSTPSRNPRTSFLHSYRPELVRILLWDGDADAAWTELQKGDCDNELWVKVAEVREQVHPEDALKVYRDVINRVVAVTSNGVYDEPVRLVRRIRAILRRQEKENEFAALIAQFRQEFKRKRNFMLALDGIEKK